MSDRIRISELREAAEVVWEPDGTEAHPTIARKAVLALVEAVEATERYFTLVRPIGMDDVDWDDLKMRYASAVRGALARFDFDTTDD